MSGSPQFDATRHRQVLGHFASGVTIVTAMGADGPAGLTAQSFTSVSLDPPLISFCPARASSTWPAIEAAGAFTVNVLTAGQEALCRVFAARDVDRFAGVEWEPGATGAPRIAGSLAWIDCRLETEYDAGDHMIVLGRVAAVDVADNADPLVFYRGGFGRFAS